MMAIRNKAALKFPTTDTERNQHEPQFFHEITLSCTHAFVRLFRTSNSLVSFATGLKEEHSMFAWAKKGVWRTTPSQEVKERRLGDWFRIGFEPLFADFTQSGSWFAVYALLEVRA